MDNEHSQHPHELAVNVRNVYKHFGTGNNLVYALKDVSFNARTNELIMIVGPSGCGKTTLLSVIAGTLRPNQGQVEVFNVNLNQLREEQLTTFRRIHIGFIFQQYHLIRTLNCLENVSIPLLLNGIKKPEAEQKAAAIMSKVGLKGREYELPLKLSGGQQQRVAIARAIVHEPRLIICDEPTAALDAETGALVLELLRQLSKEHNRCVIVVTHDNRIFKYADRLAKMDDGAILSIS